MTKKDIAHLIADRHNLSHSAAALVVQDVLDSIIDELIDNGRIELRNFGVFEVRQRAARKARNPRTGETVNVPAKKVVVFKPGKNLGKK